MKLLGSKVTPEEEKRWRAMAITTNLSTGLNMFPPYRGEIKLLRRSPGYKNTVQIKHPEDSSKMIQISYPRTIVNNPTDVIPLEAEKAMRENLKEAWTLAALSLVLMVAWSLTHGMCQYILEACSML